MTGNGKIPFLDLVTPHLELEEELVSVFRRALRTGGFVGGPMLEEFEREFAQYCETQYCVGVASGTDALRFALMAAGIEPGDTVVTVPNTFIATTEAISQAGAHPDFVDIDERTYTMNPLGLQEYLEVRCYPDPRTGRLLNQKTQKPVSAIIPVHLYGQMADMDPILELAKRYKLIVIEDACQAQGAKYFSSAENRWKNAGSVGHAAGFSFYPGKNLGACGEAGAVTTNDPRIAAKARMLRDHGQAQKYYHEMEGYNGRLDAIQAGVMTVKLKHLPDWTNRRRANASRYNELFESARESVVVPHETSCSRAVYHLYVIRTAHRDELKFYLEQADIGTGIHYPVPLHLLKPYWNLGYKAGDFPVSEKISAQILSLPMYPNLRLEQQAAVARTVTEYLVRRRSAGNRISNNVPITTV